MLPNRIAILRLLWAFTICVTSASAAIAGDESPAIAKVEAAIRREVRHKQLPAFSIAVVDGDRVVWSAGFGHLDAEEKVPAAPDSIYRVGSVSKLFTDIAVLQLVETEKIDLDAPVRDYLPEFRPRNPYDVPLTLRQMMSHQSGLVREPPVGNYFDPTEPSLSETVASLNHTELVYRPETKTKYSNAAIAVVGATLEAVTGQSHADRVRSKIFAPLGMHDSSFVVDGDQESRYATGWMRTYDGRRFEAPTFELGMAPAGNLYSSVLDLSKFLICLFHDGRSGDYQLLSTDLLRRMTTPVTNRDGTVQDFGLGFRVERLDDHTMIGHGGAIYGFSTQLQALPDQNLGVAAVASLDVTNGVVKRLIDYVLRVLLAERENISLPEYRTTDPIPSARARALVGTYQSKDKKDRVHITELGGEVFFRRGMMRHRLGAASDDGSILTDDESDFGTRVELRDDRLHVGGRAYARLPDQPPDEIPSRWRGLIGEYGGDHNTLYILEDGGQLVALIEWFFYSPLSEIDDDTFAFPNYGLYHGEGLRFTRDELGEATSVRAAGVEFVRREVGTKDGKTFQITPVAPIDDLRGPARAAKPPAETGEFRDSNLVEVTALEPSVKLDIRYATTNNFTGAVFYKQPRAFMQRPAAEAVVRVHRRLGERGLGLLIHDAYRPWYVTKMFWDATPAEFKDFVANPAQGSRHNRGCAVDLTLFDLASGEPIEMVAGYDEFSPRSFPLYPGGTSRQRWYRDLLRRAMEAEGFTVYEFEWWHFDYQDWRKYRIGNATFEAIPAAE